MGDDWSTPPTPAEMSGGQDPWAAPPTPHEMQASGPAKEPGWAEKALRFLVTPPPVTDKYASFVKSASGPDWIGNDSPDWQAAIGSAAKSFPGLIPDMGGDDRVAKFEREHPNAAIALGFAGPGGMKKAGAAAPVAQAGGGFMDKLRAFVGRAATDVGDQSGRAADATLKSATGTHGASVANASRTLERLGMTEALPTAEQAANRAVLSSPEAQTLATDLAQKARNKLPEQIGHMQSTEALMQAAQADSAAARSPEAIAEFAKNKIKDTAKTLATRYVIPSAVSAGAGALLGGDEHGGAGGAIGGVLGLGFRPGLRAIGRAATSPSVRLLGGAATLGIAEKVANLPLAQLGRFAAPIQNALKRGPTSLAAIHYKLSEDPEYQAITRKAAEQQEASHDGAAQ